jgi:hypothetical protein
VRTAHIPETNAGFGFSAAAGRLGNSGDTRDDLVVCAITEDQPTQHLPIADVGAANVFVDQDLQLHSDPAKRRLKPLHAQPAQQMGRLSVVIGNLRGSGALNVIAIGAWGTTATYCDPLESVPVAGSVEVFDLNLQGFANEPQLSLVARLHAGTADCDDLVPREVQHFGTALAIVDITRDGINDLIVGAPETDVEDEEGLGRIYIFAGDEDFLDDPYESWIGLNAPENSDPAVHGGIGFGNSIVTACLTEDSSSLRDVVVGRHDRTYSATDDEPKGGSVVVFRGQYLHDLFCGSTPNSVSDPVHSDELDPDVPEYQVLRNPFGDHQPAGSDPRGPNWSDWFGWFVFSVGDIGSPDGGTFDGIDDILVHAEDTDFIGTGSYGTPQEVDAGGNFAYFGTGDDDGPELVHPEHVLLQTPLNAGGPQEAARFGRAAARIDWYNDLTEDVEPGLLLSDIERTVGSHALAGQVYLVRVPLPAQPSDPLEHADIDNAWGSTPLTEPGGTGAGNRFGSWIVALDYWGNQGEQPGQQFVVTARESPVVYQSQTKTGAGKFYSFTPFDP